MTGPPLPMLHGPLVLVELALCVLPDVGPSRTATSRIELWEIGLFRLKRAPWEAGKAGRF